MTHKQRQEFQAFMHLMQDKHEYELIAYNDVGDLTLKFTKCPRLKRPFNVIGNGKSREFKTPGKAVMYFIHKRNELFPTKPTKPKKDK